jgi:hypothetical protein
LTWFDDKGDRYLTEAEAAQQQADIERQRSQQLAERLR